MLVLVAAGFIAGFFAPPWPWGVVVAIVLTVLSFLHRLPIYRRAAEGDRRPIFAAFLFGVVGNLALVLVPMAAVWYGRAHFF